MNVEELLTLGKELLEENPDISGKKLLYLLKLKYYGKNIYFYKDLSEFKLYVLSESLSFGFDLEDYVSVSVSEDVLLLLLDLYINGFDLNEVKDKDVDELKQICFDNLFSVYLDKSKKTPSSIGGR